MFSVLCHEHSSDDTRDKVRPTKVFMQSPFKSFVNPTRSYQELTYRKKEIHKDGRKNPRNREGKSSFLSRLLKRISGRTRLPKKPLIQAKRSQPGQPPRRPPKPSARLKKRPDNYRKLAVPRAGAVDKQLVVGPGLVRRPTFLPVISQLSPAAFLIPAIPITVGKHS